MSTIMKEIGIEKIDILKLDIEGSEFAVLEDILNEEIPIQEIIVDFHHFILKDGIDKLRHILEKLKEKYLLLYSGECYEEMTFLRK